MILDELVWQDVLLMLFVGVAWAVITTIITWKWVIPYFFGPYVRNTITAMLEKPDEETQKAIAGLMLHIMAFMGQYQVKTGNKIKVATDEVDADGKPVMKEIDEVATPMDLIARQIGNYAIMKIKGQSGGVKSQLNRVLQEGMADSGLGLSPAALSALSKGKLGPALAEVALPELLKRLNKGGTNTSSGGGWDKV